MNYSEIKNFAYNYLKDRKLIDENIEGLDFNIKTNAKFIYIEVVNKHFKSDYKSNNNSYNLVINKAKNIVIEPTEFESKNHFHRNLVFLDDKNILVPTISNRLKPSVGLYYNNYKHYQINKNNANLVKTFDHNISYTNVMLKYKLLHIGGQLYNFEQGKLYKEKFDNIWDGKCIDSFYSLANCWRIFGTKYDIQKFVNSITEKIQKEKILAGYKEISIRKGSIDYKYHTLVFIDLDGNIVSDLLYVNDSLKAVAISDYNSDIEKLKKDLEKEIDKNISVNCDTLITKQKKKVN